MLGMTGESRASKEHVSGPAAALAERLRFQTFALDRLADGSCRARVLLSWNDGREFVGEAQGMSSQAGGLGCFPEGTLAAVPQPGAGAVEPRPLRVEGGAALRPPGGQWTLAV